MNNNIRQTAGYSNRFSNKYHTNLGNNHTTNLYSSNNPTFPNNSADSSNSTVSSNSTTSSDSTASNNSNININELMQNFSNMMNEQKIPDNIKTILSSMMQNSSNPNNTNNSDNIGNSSNSNNYDTNRGDFSNSYNNSSKNTSGNFNNIDMNTIFKIQNIMNSINNDKQNESRTNLLLSLKPYLRENKRNKVDQYIQLLKMEKVFEAINPMENLNRR